MIYFNYSVDWHNVILGILGRITNLLLLASRFSSKKTLLISPPTSYEEISTQMMHNDRRFPDPSHKVSKHKCRNPKQPIYLMAKLIPIRSHH
jgi:hypothetical protein